MNRITSLALAVALLSVLVAACTAPSPAETRTFLIDVPETGDAIDIPWFMAVEALEEQGYAIERVHFSAVDATTVLAMDEGNLDMCSMSNQLAWSAIAEGAPLITFLDMAPTQFILGAKKEVQTCADLDGRPVAISEVSTVSGAMLNVYIERNCPEAEPDFLIVKKASGRMAALLSGEVDAATIDLQGLIYLEGEDPGAYHALIIFAEEFPGLQINSYVTRRDLAEQYPELIKDLIRAVFDARRSLQDPQLLSEAIVEYLPVQPPDPQQVADLYLSGSTWDLSGEYTLDTVQATMDFMQEYGDLAPELEAKDVADLSYYEAVLDEIGRQ
jgi:ABC-type nitrate/sulfonate/bicarbonate transport system substrate-binding protein